MNAEVYQDLQPGKRTRYNGRSYRSRSEAKWAHVFTTLGVPFYYEPSHYRLASGLYLPDFWLPTIDAYIEVKPFDVADPRYSELGQMRGKRVFLVAGDLPAIPHSWLEEDVYPCLTEHIWLKWPDEQPNYMLAQEAQGRINIVPIALASSAKGNAQQILTAYIEASSYPFKQR